MIQNDLCFSNVYELLEKVANFQHLTIQRNHKVIYLIDDFCPYVTEDYR